MCGSTEWGGQPNYLQIDDVLIYEPEEEVIPLSVKSITADSTRQNAKVSVEFNKDVNVASLDNITVTKNGGGGGSIGKSISMIDGKTCQLTFNDLLELGTYTVTVPTTVTDSDGNALPSAATGTFTVDTAADQSGIFLGYIPKTVKIPYSGAYQVQLNAVEKNSDGDVIDPVAWSLVDSGKYTSISVSPTGLLTVRSDALPHIITVKAESSVTELEQTAEISVTYGGVYKLYEDFSSYNPGAFADGTKGWTAKKKAEAAIDVVADPVTGNKSIKLSNLSTITDQTDWYGCLLQYGTAIQNTKAVTEFDIRFNNPKADIQPRVVAPVILQTVKSTADNKIYLCYKQSGVDSQLWPKLTEVVDGQWYHIRIEEDMTTGNATSQKASVYVNNVLVEDAANIPFTSGGTENALWAFKTVTSLAGGISVQFDNIVMYTEGMEDTMHINGSSTVSIPASGSTTAAYTVDKCKQVGGADANLSTIRPLKWYLSDAPAGVTVNKDTGVITVPGALQAGKKATLYVQSYQGVAAMEILFDSPKFNMSDVSLTYNDGTAVGVLGADGDTTNIVEASVNVQNTSGQNMKLLYALYSKEGQLMGVTTSNVATDAPTTWQNIPVTLSVPSSIDGNYIKLFVWNDSLTPLFDTFEYYSAKDPVTIFLIGDSIVANYSDPDPTRGWGQVLGNKFTGDVTVRNFAIGGQSANSFRYENNWKTIMSDMKPGDYVFIQFGHNDGGATDRGSDPYTTYMKYLDNYIQTVRSKGAIPILITSPTTLSNFVNGVIPNGIGKFPQAMRDLAAERNVPLIDLNQLSITSFSALGYEKCSNDIFMADKCHFKLEGANLLADLIIDSIGGLNLPLENFIVE